MIEINRTCQRTDRSGSRPVVTALLHEWQRIPAYRDICSQKGKQIKAIHRTPQTTNCLSVFLEDFDHFSNRLTIAFREQRNMERDVVNVFDMISDILDSARKSGFDVMGFEVTATLFGQGRR